LDRHDEAIEAYDKALEIDPDYATAWHNKGTALKALGKNHEANKAYKKAKELE
jgi:tetratricopeptide (TPR) repeat protein